MPRRFGLHKYTPLTRYLAGLTVDEVTLTLTEIEQIIGAPLPVSARDPTFWSNGTVGVFKVRPWVQAGWRMVRTRLGGEPLAVTFVRVADVTVVPPAPASVLNANGPG